MNRIDFRNIEERLSSSITSDQYEHLIDKVVASKRIYLLGNGGLHFVANHAATDMTRLVPGKAVYSFESIGFVTSNVNDYSGEQMFTRWLETISYKVDEPEETLVIGLSCSGNSANVISGLEWAKKNGYDAFMISGVKSKKLPNYIRELVLDCKYFHEAEVLTLMIFYDLIVKCGHSCPTILEENIRKGYIPGINTI